MKTVFTNGMLAHVYAQQNQYEGRSHNGNFWFENGSLYSYSTLMMFTFEHKGVRYVFENAESYSVTTSGKQMNQISESSFPMPVKYFSVYNAERKNRQGAIINYTASHTLLENLKHAFEPTRYGTKAEIKKAQKTAINEIIQGQIQRAIEHQGKANRRRSESLRGWDLATVGYCIGNAKTLATEFRCKSIAKIPADITKAGEIEAKAQAARLKKARALEKKRAEEARVIQAEKFAEWQSGESDWCPNAYRNDAQGSVYMRIKNEELQTSANARVPLRHALRAFKMVKHCKEQGLAWRRNGSQIRVGHFQIDSIAKNGDMVAGCHKFSYARILEVATRENLQGVIAEDVTKC